MTPLTTERPGKTPVEEALRLVLGRIKPLEGQDVPLDEARRRILAKPVKARDNVPFDDNSAMDGFAVRADDLETATTDSPVRLRISKTVLTAGPAVNVDEPAGVSVKIMTGAAIPPGFDAVVPIENVVVDGEAVIFTKRPASGEHIRSAGQDLRKGDVSLTAGSRLDPVSIGIAVISGAPTVTVYRRPRVALLTSGDELIGPGDEMASGYVRNANTPILHAALLEMGCEVVDLGVARDDKEEIADRVESALAADVLITSGGVSVGERDFLREVLTEAGMETVFWGVNMKPGKPLLFGMIGRTAVFGLPGNPVSTSVTFELFVRPAVRKLAGALDLFPPFLRCRMLHEIDRRPGRPEFQRVRLEYRQNGWVASLTRAEQGSGLLTSMQSANGLLYIDPDVISISENEEVFCLWLDGDCVSEFTLPGQEEEQRG